MKTYILSFLVLFSSQCWSASKALEIIPTLHSLAGSPVQLEPKAKGYVVVFLSAKCPCSNSHIPELKELSQKYKDFEFIAVHSNLDETKDMTQAYFQKVNLPFALVHDPGAVLADELKAYKTPHVFVLSAAGDILYQGGVTNSNSAAKATEHYLKDALEDLQQGQKVRVAYGRTLGCVISREKIQNVW